MADSDALYRKRQGFWLRMAREAAGYNQAGAAEKLGLKTKSAISDYETGTTEAPQKRLRALAKLYSWDLEIFTDPQPTAEEMAQERMSQKARAAIRVADQVSAEEAAEERPAGGDSPGAEPQRRSA
jgi:transcriptional regulator with XRE-family HTH domain